MQSINSIVIMNRQCVLTTNFLQYLYSNFQYFFQYLDCIVTD